MQHQVCRKTLRQMQMNSRFLIAIVLLKIIFVIYFIVASRSSLNDDSEKHTAVHKYLSSLFKERRTMRNHNDDDNSTNIDAEELVWSNETVELFQDQLGLTLLMTEKSDDETKIKCESEFMLSALPSAEEENFYEALWQFFSLDATERVTIICDDSGKKLTLRAVITERIKVYCEKLFERLSLDVITTYPSACFDLKLAKIIGNISPIELKGIENGTPFLLDPAAKRWKEISQRWALKMRPNLKLRKDLLKSVDAELVMSRTLLEIESSRDNDFNYVGVYITSEDKLPTEYYHLAINFHRKNAATIFLVICDELSFSFCRELFENEKNPDKEDARISRRSSAVFDFALMANCNATIVSNEMGLLHSLMSGGITTVFHPNSDSSYYVPFLMSEQMENWYAISVVV